MNYDDMLSLDLPWERLRGKSVLVTGANGLIASALVEALCHISKQKDLHTHLYALCRSWEKGERRFSALLNDEDFSMVIQDVVKPLDLDIKFDYIIHAASSAHPKAFNDTPVDVMKANILGSMNVLEQTIGSPETRVMIVSSSEVYGENFEGTAVFSEDTPGAVDHMRFRACYPESKRASETLAFCYAKQYGSDVVIVRPAYIYGKDIIDDNTRADVYFMRQALNHENIVMYSEGTQIRSYCYIKDCISAMLYVLIKGESGNIYNIGNRDCIVTLREYAASVAKHGGVELIIDKSTQPSNTVFLQTTKLVLDTAKLEGLGWKARYSLEDGMNDIFGSAEG